MRDVLVNLAVCAGVVAVLLAVVFIISVRRDRHDLIDVARGLGCTLIAGTTFGLSTGDLATRVVLTVRTAAWGRRLAVHIGLRNARRPEDRRYVEIRPRGGTARLVRVGYLTQGAVMLLVSLPVPAGVRHLGGVATVAAPVVLTVVLAAGTGKPLTEKHLARSRPATPSTCAARAGSRPGPHAPPELTLWAAGASTG